jgi:hypothetical protein
VIAKEFRALLPAWAAAAVAMAACAVVPDLRPFGIAAYFIGAATLGAMSMGHEYSHRTVGLMLTLPVSRGRLLVTKLVVLAALLLLLALLARLIMPLDREAARFVRTIVWLPFFSALCITPYLTTLTRSPVGGAVFTMGIAGMLTVAGEWAGIAKYGYTRNVDTFRLAFVWRAEMLLCAASAILMSRTFLRLQSFDGPGPSVDLTPQTATRSPALTRRNATWLLIGKELRLQQLAFAIAAFYVVAYLGLLMRTRGLFSHNDGAFIMSLLYAGVLAVVIGSVASAEERHLRTIDAQLLLPMPTSRQWLIKIGVVLGLTFLLAIVLPAALAVAFPPERIVWARNIQAGVSGILGVMALATLSLYVSTLCSSGLWALLLSVPAAFAGAAFVLKLADVMHGVLFSLDGRPDWSIVRWATAIVTVPVIALVLRLALTNHRSADRSRMRIAAQVAGAAAAAVVAVTLIGVAGALSR